MKVNEIYDYLNELSPFELQESWDNSGLLVGDKNQEIDKIYLSLDLDLELVDSIEENSLIITHHPLIFKPLKSLVPISYSQKIAIKLIQKNITLISMHTNFDKTHLNKYVMKEVLGFEYTIEDDFILSAQVNFEFEEFVKYIKEKLNLKSCNVVECHKKINSFSLTTGSGMSLLNNIKTDLFLTGDIKYHEAMEAKARGISLIDITHYESEKYFVDALFKELKDLEKLVIIHNSKNPFKRL
ncbi:MAG: Nif3-like dinuclear metal center hexameric protein [Nautilia sp.]|nr:MAG: Nif3-like dinuclear metal center hexameric protein [Nautilia sp.]